MINTSEILQTVRMITEEKPRYPHDHDGYFALRMRASG